MSQLAEYCFWCDGVLNRGAGAMTYHDSRFCSDTCRSRYHNARKKLKRAEAAVWDALEFINSMLLTQGDLQKESLALAQKIASLSNVVTVDCRCGNCGQGQFLVPEPNQVCDFCQHKNWVFKPKRKNPPKE